MFSTFLQNTESNVATIHATKKAQEKAKFANQERFDIIEM